MLEQSVMDTNRSIQTDDTRSGVKRATVSRARQIADFVTLAFSPDPVHQNKGDGAAWLKHTLAVGDREGKPAYSESSNPRNISFYERFGFELTGKIRVGLSAAAFPVLRKACQQNADAKHILLKINKES